MTKKLSLRQFGDPVLRQKAKRMSGAEILSPETQKLIADIHSLNAAKQYGVGLSAPQVGLSLALSVIGIKPTPTRPDLEPFNAVIINPTYEGIGRRTGLWEGCQSCGRGNDTLYGKALRYRKIHASWLDEHAKPHDEVLEGFVAHVFQHETDHVNGVLFVDRVRDTKSYIMADEFRSRVVTPTKRLS